MTTNTYSSLWFQLFMPLQSEEWTEKDVAFLARKMSPSWRGSFPRPATAACWTSAIVPSPDVPRMQFVLEKR